MTALVLFALQLAAADYRASIEQWRASQEASLKSDRGWLTVAGLTWLEEGRNTIELPEGAPQFGVFELRAGKVFFHPAEGGTPVEMRPDSAGRPTTIERGAVSVHVIHRGRRIGIRLRDKNSKLRREFTGRKWYPVKPELRLEASWVPYNPPKPIKVPNILGDTNDETAPGYAEFEIGLRKCRLEPIGQPGSPLFFIFRDLTSGKESYGAGRFLYADRPAAGKVILDFNKATNPPCAFTPYATCPLPPRQNRLPVRIEAGELRYGVH